MRCAPCLAAAPLAQRDRISDGIDGYQAQG